jgi:hypothetical protein
VSETSRTKEQNTGHDFWAVEVRTDNGDTLVEIGWRHGLPPNTLGLSAQDIATIRKAAHALLTFIGDSPL